MDSPWETFELPHINSALALGADVAGAVRLAANADSTGCFAGQQPGHDGFRLTAGECRELREREPQVRDITFPYLNGQELLTAAYATAPRYIVCSRVTKRPIFEFLDRAFRPDSNLTVFPFADDCVRVDATQPTARQPARYFANCRASAWPPLSR